VEARRSRLLTWSKTCGRHGVESGVSLHWRHSVAMVVAPLWHHSPCWGHHIPYCWGHHCKAPYPLLHGALEGVYLVGRATMVLLVSCPPWRHHIWGPSWLGSGSGSEGVLGSCW
jgi:hypothetical protein